MNPCSRSPELETARLVLRALSLEDAEFIFKEWSDPVVVFYMRDEDPLKSRGQAVEFLRRLQTPEEMPDFKSGIVNLAAYRRNADRYPRAASDGGVL